MSVVEVENPRKGATAAPPERNGAAPTREVRHEYTRTLPPLLSQLGVSLLVSTYQAGKVVAVGVAQGELTLSYHNFERAMGLAVKPDGPDTSLSGAATITSSDPRAILPASVTLTNGVGQFSATLGTLGTNQSVIAADRNNAALTATQSGIEVIPFASITGPSAGALNQTLTFTLGAGSDPAGTVFTVSWGDGSSVQTTGVTASHTYTTSANYDVRVTAAAAGLSSQPAAQFVNILPVSVAIQADAANPARQVLVVTGTANSDNIVLASGASNGLALTFDGWALGDILPTNGGPFALVMVFGEGGTTSSTTRGTCQSAVCWWAAPATIRSGAAAAATCSSAARGPTRCTPAAAATSSSAAPPATTRT